MRILLLSTIVPANSFGGPLLLHRHLVERHDFEVLVIGPDEMAGTRQGSLVDRLFQRIRRSRFANVARHYEHLWKFRSLSKDLEHRVELFQPQVVLTVAHGPLFWLAKKVAKQRRLPLISVFHDWWPYLATRHGGASNFTAKKIEHRFRSLYRQSDCVLPVCEGMREELGDHANSVTLLPIPPAFAFPQCRKVTSESNEKIVYMGNMTSGYGRMIRDLISESGQLKSRLRCFGNSSDWPVDFRNQCISDGILSDGIVPEEELVPYLANAAALIVTLPMAGDPPIARRTSFPSKLSSYLKYGRPILFWGSEDSSLIQWAKGNESTAVFTQQHPRQIVEFLERVVEDHELSGQLCDEAIAFQERLDPEAIHAQFRSAIMNTVPGPNN